MAGDLDTSEIDAAPIIARIRDVAERLTLARAFRASGMEQEAAENVATAIFDVVHDNVATKAALAALTAAIRTDIAGLAAARKADTAELDARIDLVEHR